MTTGPEPARRAVAAFSRPTAPRPATPSPKSPAIWASYSPSATTRRSAGCIAHDQSHRVELRHRPPPHQSRQRHRRQGRRPAHGVQADRSRPDTLGARSPLPTSSLSPAPAPVSNEASSSNASHPARPPSSAPQPDQDLVSTAATADRLPSPAASCLPGSTGRRRLLGGELGRGRIRRVKLAMTAFIGLRGGRAAV